MNTTLSRVFVGMVVLMLGSATARAADPYAARYSHDATAIFWIMHISDTHIGASSIEGPNAVPHFEFALGEAFTTIDGDAVIVTGDLCDGSIGFLPASGQGADEWLEYRTIVDSAGMTTDFYIDMPGNHDAYGEGSGAPLSFYLANSLHGSTFGTTTRTMVLDFPFGQYLLYGISTAMGSPIFAENPEFSAVDVADMDAAFTANATATLAIAFGHHPLSSPDNNTPVIDLLQLHQGFWFHGHRHDHGSYSQHFLVSGEVGDLGKGATNNIAVIAVDNDAMTYEITDVNDPWPLVLVTTPSDRRLDSGDENPYAYDVCNTATDNPVRALVFDASPVSEVSFSMAGGSAVPMTQDAVEPRLWHGVWDTTGLAVGETTITVTAVGNNTRSRHVSVMLADVTCPTVNPQPDAGVVDAGPGPQDAGTDGTADASADAAVSEDASGPAPDAGDPPGANAPGCGCRSSNGLGHGPSPVGLVTLLLLLTLLWRRRNS